VTPDIRVLHVKAALVGAAVGAVVGAVLGVLGWWPL
jgi:hypothetical protein